MLGLAEVLADSRAKASVEEIEKLLSKCPEVPINKGTDIFTREKAPGLGSMVLTVNLKKIKAQKVTFIY